MRKFSLTAKRANLPDLILQLIAIGFVLSKSDFMRLLRLGCSIER